MTKIKFTPSAAINNWEFVKNEIAKRHREITNIKLARHVDEAKITLLQEEMGELGDVYPTAYCIVHSCLMSPHMEIIDSDIELLIKVINKFKK